LAHPIKYRVKNRVRHRHQNGWVELTAANNWKAHWYEYVLDPETGKERRKHRSQIVGAKASMRKYEAEAELDKLVAPVNSSKGKQDNRVTFSWFYDHRYKPAHEGRWGPATRNGNGSDVERYIRPHLGDIPLVDLDLFICQTHLNKLADKQQLCEDIVKRCRRMVRSTLEYAVELGFLDRNPAKKVEMPVCKPTKKPVISREDLNRLFNAVTDPRDKLILYIGTFCATTASELFGLTWECYNGDQILIRNTAWAGTLYEWRVKRKVRHRLIFLAPRIQEAFERWRELAEDTSGTALVFPGKNGKPMWPGVFLQDHIQPIAKKLGIAVSVNFQVLRRSCGTRNQRHGSMKDVQTHLGHSDIGTTGNVYVQEVPASVKQMVLADVEDVFSAKPASERIQ
jgi:integrase